MTASIQLTVSIPNDYYYLIKEYIVGNNLVCVGGGRLSVKAACEGIIVGFVDEVCKDGVKEEG